MEELKSNNTESAAPATGAPVVESTASQPAAQATDVSSPVNGESNNPTNNPQAGGQTGQNWEQEYKRLQDLYSKREQSYNELRKKLTVQGTEKNTYAKELQEIKERNARIEDMLRKATAPQYDPAKFSEELSARGPDYILDLVKQNRDSIVGEYEKKLGELSQKVQQAENSRAVKERVADAANYPNFQELSPAMAEMYQQNMEFFDANYPDVDGRLDALYTAAKLQHSQDAIEQAKKLGEAKANQQLATEAQTGVATGGKHTSTQSIDLAKASSADLKKHFQSLGMTE